MQELLYGILYDLTQLAMLAAATYAVAFLRKRIAADKLRIMEIVTKEGVLFVQQVYWDLNGEDKYKLALHRVSELLAKRGINVAPDELRVFIESAVKQFKKEFGEQW